MPLLALIAVQSLLWTDLPVELRSRVAGDGAAFEGMRARLAEKTLQRIARGEDEHLIYFVLQSRSFTSLPPIEPAASAGQWKQTGSAPADVRARMAAFLTGGGQGERLAWFRSLRPSPQRLERAYFEAMAFLYEKEFGGGGTQPYRRRGHSSDSDPEVNYTVYTGLGVIRGLDPKFRAEQVLIVGPGLDFAPRTGMREDDPPRGLQPWLTADSIVRLGLARDPRVHCADANPRVVEFAPRRPDRVRLPVWDDPEYRDFAAGAWSKPRGPGTVGATRVDIVTQRLAATFDLIVATNILLYFDDTELALALASLRSMLRPGGWLLHNEIRPALETLSRELGMPPVQGRTLQVGRGRLRPLIDTFVLHVRK